jgi:L-ascorbate metabolism protein UlaG (beta-lactamase superfamily)
MLSSGFSLSSHVLVFPSSPWTGGLQCGCFHAPSRERKESGMDANITLIGGPTALIEAGGFRLLTDPPFDGPGEYRQPHVTLKKTSKPALSADSIGEIDAVLLSHDQHADNLDHAGRAFLANVGRVLTTAAGARCRRRNGALANKGLGWPRWQPPAGHRNARGTGPPASSRFPAM